jgi:hypothetical protein
MLLVKNTDVDILINAPPVYEASRAGKALWLAPISPHNHPPSLPPQLRLQQANSAYHQPSLPALATFLHATAGFPAKSTFCKAIDSGFFATWPELTSDLIRKHLPLSVPSIMGRMRRTPQGIRSTKLHTMSPPAEPPLAPPRSPLSCDHLVSADVCKFETLNAMISTDQPGRFPFTSTRGMNYIFLLYDHDSNAILVHPIKSRQAHHLVEGYDACYAKLQAAGINPVLHKLDNEISNAMRTAITTKKLKYQLADTHDHHANPAERAIGTFKNHFTAILSGCDSKFPPSLWCHLLHQAEITVNLLRPSRINPKLSAYHQVFGIFDFNRTPMAPLGTKAIIYEPKAQRKSTFASHGALGWYIGPAPHHYRNYKIYVPTTRGTRFGKTVQFIPSTFPMPAPSSADKASLLVEDLIHEIKNPAPASAFHEVGTSGTTAICTLQTFFKTKPPTDPPPRVALTPVIASPRVKPPTKPK